MPEYPDITVYIESLEKRLLGQTLIAIRLNNPFLLRTADPPISAIQGTEVRRLRRVGKRIAFGFDNDLWLVLHLMIAGRLHWKPAGAKSGGKNALAAFDFPNGTLTLTEAGSKRRASLHLLRGDADLNALDPGGMEVMTATLEGFSAALTSENHTLKRSLTDPRLFSGIGNAYSDEILFEAKLSPIALTQKLSADDIRSLYNAIRSTMEAWVGRLRAEAGDDFPEKVTAFRPEMTVHGRYGQPCVRCGGAVQRIRYVDNETNYCPTCQTDGKLLADRALSRLLGKDWPKSLEELEMMTSSKRL